MESLVQQSTLPDRGAPNTRALVVEVEDRDISQQQEARWFLTVRYSGRLYGCPTPQQSLI